MKDKLAEYLFLFIISIVVLFLGFFFISMAFKGDLGIIGTLLSLLWGILYIFIIIRMFYQRHYENIENEKTYINYMFKTLKFSATYEDDGEIYAQYAHLSDINDNDDLTFEEDERDLSVFEIYLTISEELPKYSAERIEKIVKGRWR